jgi:hypothetical protein
LLVSAWEGFAASCRALADAGESGDQAAWNRAAAMQDEPRKDSMAAWQAIKQLKQQCGIAGLLPLITST